MPSKDRIVRVPIGPQHPALKEPEGFMVDLQGERISSIALRLGYNHRGIEKGCEERTYVQDIYLIERVCGICSHSHSTAFVMAVEEIAGLELPRRAQYIRTLVGELERIHSHLLWLGVAGHEIGFDTLLMYSWRDRELVMDLLAELTGNRVHYAMNVIGGVKRDITPEQMARIAEVVDALEERTKYYIELAMTEETLAQRLSGVGRLSKADAELLGTIGPTGRASGIDRDTRRDDPYAAYDELEFKVVTDDHCDVFGRTLVRLGELMEVAKTSLEIKRKVLEKFTENSLYPYTKFYLRAVRERFGQYWKNHFSTIGLVGLNEACENLLGADIASPKGQLFGLRVLEFMRERLVAFQEQTGNNYNLEATPAEGTSYRLARIDAERFPGIRSANIEGGKPFYTNSSQLPVHWSDDPFEVLDLQDELQTRYTGGTVVHLFIGEEITNPASVAELVRVICSRYRLPYFTITPTFSICPVHGYLPGKQDRCPTCNAVSEVYSRVVGYLRPVNQWNEGKVEEFKQRKTFRIAQEAARPVEAEPAVETVRAGGA